jgi:hypothetical protein
MHASVRAKYAARPMSRATAFILSCSVLAFSCPPPPSGIADAGTDAGVFDPNPDDVVSGTRLHARWEVAGGARRLIGWRDTQLDLDCDFSQFVSGRKHYCLPPMLELQAGDSPEFADAQCTQRVAFNLSNPQPCTTASYVMDVPVDVCANEPTFFSSSPLDAGVAYKLEDGGCTPLTLSSAAFAVGAAVPSATFVSAIETPSTDGQFWLVTTDGARQPWGGWDGMHAVVPFPFDVDGGMRWAPWMVAYAGEFSFSDATCTTPVAVKDTSSSHCPLDGVELFASQTCGPELAGYVAIGAQLTDVFASTGGMCEATPTTGAAYYSVGARLTGFRVADMSFIGDGGVQVAYSTLDDKAIRQGRLAALLDNGPVPDTFFDVASQLPCSALPGSDGKLRCIPAPSGLAPSFLDGACTQRVLTVASADPSCATSPVPNLYVDQDAPFDGCSPGAVHGYPVMGIADAGMLFYSLAGQCLSSGPVQSNVTVYLLGPELDASRFAEVTTEVTAL